MRAEKTHSLSGNQDLMSLFEGIYREYGYDLRNYRRNALAEPMSRALGAAKSTPLTELARRLSARPELIPKVVERITTCQANLFDNPGFFADFRRLVVPWLKTFPSFRVWVAGPCAAEEAYGLEICLLEEQAPRHNLYVTEVNELKLTSAARWSLPGARWDQAQANYAAGGGRASLCDYVVRRNGRMVLDRALRENMHFFAHNLATDASFREFQVIVSRFGTLDFAKRLRQRVYTVFDKSLRRFGVLGLGSHDSLSGTNLACGYRELGPDSRLYKRSH